MKAKGTDFTEANFEEVRFKKFKTKECIFKNNSFFKTPLKGLDFSDDEFENPIFSEGNRELVKLKVNRYQAADLAAFLGVIVKD